MLLSLSLEQVSSTAFIPKPTIYGREKMKKQFAKICLILCGVFVFLTGCVDKTETTELKLPHYLNYDFTTGQDVKFENINMKMPDLLDEVKNAELTEYSQTLEPIIDIILIHYPDFDPSRWKITIHFFDEEKSVGNIQLMYFIENINTNKIITCTIENERITQISYSNLGMETDEAELVKRVNVFEEQHTQTKKTMKKSEEFISENVEYSYCYNVDKLVYTYSLFFYEETKGLGKVVNNDYVSEYFID